MNRCMDEAKKKLAASTSSSTTEKDMIPGGTAVNMRMQMNSPSVPAK